jgi:uncharacterized OB-fold protein
MKVNVCTGCGYESFERRAVCPKCLGEEFGELNHSDDDIVPLIEAALFVTPAGFGESYTIEIARVGSTRALLRHS